MADPPVRASTLKQYLVDDCGYGLKLITENYTFAADKTVGLAAFAHRPFDARSACIAAIDTNADGAQSAVMACREFGAPVVFACLGNRLQVWKPGPTTAEPKEPGLLPRQIPRFFKDHRADLAPGRIYEAKTIGRIPGSGRQLDFVDAGLLPFAEGQMGEKLTQKVADAASLLRGVFPENTPLTLRQREWIVKSTFRLLAAKVLQDKEVPNFRSLRLSNLDDVFRRVQRHYGSQEEVEIGGAKRRAVLEQASKLFRNLSSLRNLTTEALADVYEEALVTPRTRDLLGTHSTPSYLVDYIIWQLAPWIEKIDPGELRVLEPGCGHAPFLVGAMRLLRNFDLGRDPRELSAFFRERLCGIEQDSFALEIARLSLTVADVPNPDGWQGLQAGDMFESTRLQDAAKQCRLLLANPPFEGGKPLRLLENTLPYLPPAAVFGVVVPATLLHARGVRHRSVVDLRRCLVERCQLAEVSLFPDGLFTFADQECAIMLGRRLARGPTPATLVRCKRVREDQRDGFEQRYEFPSDRRIQQAMFAERSGFRLWIPELQEDVWSWLRECPRLVDIADVSQGLAYKRKRRDRYDTDGRPPNSKTVEPRSFAGGVMGYARPRGQWMTYSQPALSCLNLAEDVIGCARLGADTGVGQVLIVRHPPRGIWRLKPFIDEAGRPFTSNFNTVRPKALNQHPLHYIFALCSSPLANAYVYTHSLKRDIQDGDFRELPVPRADADSVRRVAQATRDYLEAAGHFDGSAGEATLPLFSGSPKQDKVDRESLHRFLMRMDAEVLRLYDLPARAERKLLDRFSGKVRPGVPGQFAGYYPDGFTACVPLYVYLTDTYQRFLREGTGGVPAELRARYDELLDKRLQTELDPAERDELHRLEAEMDGGDYAAQPPDDSWLAAREAEQRASRQTMDQISARIVDLT
ncbi:MAG TPA: N-6 DNA methylase [Phycisphaerae bacterium]|nr:N-6 DNA methylase [Phycisphaerae bacterium]HNU43740.1 N-6 DNA methylase [Phycisphaerae bacterium]